MNNNLQKIFFGASLAKIKLMFGGILNPKRDWIILLTLFFIVTVSSIVFDVYIYRQIVNGDMYVSVNKEDIVIEDLKTDQLQKILSNFEEKNTKITSLKLENTVDPSI